MIKEKILIVDDEEPILRISKEILKRKNFLVKTANNGEEGIRLFTSEDFDLIITDIRMPNRNGLDLIRYVRNYNKVIPIIVFTGYATLEMAISALRLGAQGFLLKPFTPADLENVVMDALEKVRLMNENIRMRALLPLFEVSRKIIGELDIEKLLRMLVNITVKEISADSVWVALLEEGTDSLFLKGIIT
jgi:DNA-binding NtrC family response regulator